MSLSPESRQARGRIAINKRHHPDKPELVADDIAALEQERIRRHIEAIDAAGRAGKMTPELRDLIGRLFHYGPAPESSTAR
jgi:hypothetical protein